MTDPIGATPPNLRDARGEDVAQGWVEGCSDRDWGELPQDIQDQLTDAANAFLGWWVEQIEVIDAQTEPRQIGAD